MKIPKIEYLAVDFESPPHGEQLTTEFGDRGWQLTAMLPISLVQDPENEDEEEIVLHRIRAFFMRPVIANPEDIPDSNEV